MPAARPAGESAIAQALSQPRMSTYLAATGEDPVLALELYGWNARMSAALMLPAHFAEVATRNAVSDALTAVYGARWPWDSGFARSLPSSGRYNPRRDLTETAAREATTGKVIAELKFVFWQKMFTARHDTRVWEPQILALFPGAPAGTTPAQLRQRIYDDLEAIRLVRNRMAHHEPIFSRNLADDLAKMLDLVDIRSTATATWVRSMQEVTAVLHERPATGTP